MRYMVFLNLSHVSIKSNCLGPPSFSMGNGDGEDCFLISLAGDWAHTWKLQVSCRCWLLFYMMGPLLGFWTAFSFFPLPFHPHIQASGRPRALHPAQAHCWSLSIRKVVTTRV